VEIMREIEFHIPKQCDLAAAEVLIERACAESGLLVGMKGSLASYPGCVHWHYKKPNQKGTLELPLYGKESRLWAQVQDGRKAAWIEVELPRLQRAIERELRHQTRYG
jgi:hypothetical protein